MSAHSMVTGGKVTKGIAAKGTVTKGIAAKGKVTKGIAAKGKGGVHGCRPAAC